MTFGQGRIILSVISFALFGTVYLPSGWTVAMPMWGEPPTSILASKCERLWLDEARNDSALECYLTSQPSRLCREGEKAHLLWFMKRYQVARTQFDAKLWKAVTAVGLGMANPPEPGADGKRDGVAAHFNKLSAAQAARLKADEAFVRAMKMPTRTDSDLSAMVRRLAEKGYVTADDFGWGSPDWVSEAFEGTLKVNAACPKPEA